LPTTQTTTVPARNIMSTPSFKPPLRFEPSFEHLEDGEADTIKELIETMQHIAEITYRDGHRGLRSVHAKSHGLLHGELTIPEGLPPELAQGLFAQPGTYPAILRLSTTPGDVLADSVSTPRGLAVKLLNVTGPRVEGSESETTQDFVMVNGPAFNASTAKAFAKNAKLLASTTDKAEGFKKALSAVLRGTEKLIEAVGGESATIKSLGGHPQTHPLGETYYTQAPVLFGAYMAKLSLAPVSPGLTALTDAPVDLKDKPDGLRVAVSTYFATQGGEWELRVQLCTDIEKMPIENSSVPWPESDSPYLTVGRLSVPPEETWPEAQAHGIEDRLAFNPWHALAAHRPLGSIMRVRRAVYDASMRFRTQHNGVSAPEPSSLDQVVR